MILSPVFLVAFSGHRPSAAPGRSNTELDAAATRIGDMLGRLAERSEKCGGKIELVTSLAAGADIVACETAIRMNIPVHIVLPMPWDEFLATFAGVESWILRAQAIMATIIPAPECLNVKRSPHHTQRVAGITRTDPDCFAETNTFLLDAADVLLTVSNEIQPRSAASTTYLAKQAAALGIPHMNINPASPGDAPPAIPYSFADPECPSLARHLELMAHVDCPADGRASRFSTLTHCLERAANKSSAFYRRSMAYAISCHATATVIAALVASLYHGLKKYEVDETTLKLWFAAVAFVELVFVALGWFLEKRLHSRYAQRIWLHARYARELMRGVEAACKFVDPLAVEPRHHKSPWKRFFFAIRLQAASEAEIPAPTDIEAIDKQRRDYLKHRVADQRAFFTRKAEAARLPAMFFHHLAHKAAFAALVVVTVAFSAKLMHAWGSHTPLDSVPFGNAIILLFLPILFPLLAGLSASFNAAFDFRRRNVRYQEMAEILSGIEVRLSAMATSADIRSTVADCEEILRDELNEWLAAQKSGLGH